MNKYVPLNKRSKKEQKLFNNAQRKTWNGKNPATTTFSDKKKFDKAGRSRDKAALRTGADNPHTFGCGDFLFGTTVACKLLCKALFCIIWNRNKNLSIVDSIILIEV